MKTNKPLKGVSDYRKVISKILRETPFLTSVELAKELNVPRDTAYWYLKVMRDEGLITNRKREGTNGTPPAEFFLVRKPRVSADASERKWEFPADVQSEKRAPTVAQSNQPETMVGVQVPIHGKLQTLSVSEARSLYTSLKQVFE